MSTRIIVLYMLVVSYLLSLKNMVENVVNQVRYTFTTNVTRFVAVSSILVAGVAKSMAQVSLTIDTDAIFTSINTWLATFDDVVAIGIGIAAAIVILTFIGNQIIKAFGGRGNL